MTFPAPSKSSVVPDLELNVIQAQQQSEEARQAKEATKAAEKERAKAQAEASAALAKAEKEAAATIQDAQGKASFIEREQERVSKQDIEAIAQGV